MTELAGLFGQVESVSLLSAPPRYSLALICTSLTSTSTVRCGIVICVTEKSWREFFRGQFDAEEIFLGKYFFLGGEFLQLCNYSWGEVKGLACGLVGEQLVWHQAVTGLFNLLFHQDFPDFKCCFLLPHYGFMYFNLLHCHLHYNLL